MNGPGSFRKPPEPMSAKLRLPKASPGMKARRNAWLSLARVLNSGLSIQDGLHMLSEDTSGSLGTSLAVVSNRVSSGATLSTAMASQPGLLSPAELQMLKAAERVGTLSEAFDTFAKDLNLRIALRDELIRRAGYPSFLIISAIFFSAVPLLVSATVLQFLTVVGSRLGLFAALVVAGVLFCRWLGNRETFHRLLWRLPVVGSLYTDGVMGRLTMVMGRNLAAGLPLHEAVESAALSTGDAQTLERTRLALARIEQGAEFSEACLHAELFPSKRRIQLVTAERSGTLSECLDLLGVEYIERHHQRLTSWVTMTARGVTIIVMLAVAGAVVTQAQKAIFGPLEQLGPPGSY